MPRSSSPILVGCLQPSQAACEPDLLGLSPFPRHADPSADLCCSSPQSTAIAYRRAEPYRWEAQPGAGCASTAAAAVEAAGLRDDLLAVTAAVNFPVNRRDRTGDRLEARAGVQVGGFGATRVLVTRS